MTGRVDPTERAVFELAAQFRRMGKDFEVDVKQRLNDSIKTTNENQGMSQQEKFAQVDAIKQTARLLGIELG